MQCDFPFVAIHMSKIYYYLFLGGLEKLFVSEHGECQGPCRTGGYSKNVFQYNFRFGVHA